MGIPRFYGDQVTIANVADLSVGVNAGILPQTGVANAHVAANAGIAGSKLAAPAQRKTLRGPTVWDIDAGGSTTYDEVLMVPSTAITITKVRAIYSDATTGAITAANFKLGTSANGTQIVSAANGALEASKTVGQYSDFTISSGAVAANTPVWVRYSAIAATAAGKVQIQIEYTVDDV
jgi:hypothetical protein